MFSLIITIISIALVAALAIASIYYGGAAFSQGSAKAAASTVVAQAQQISAANTLYQNDNAGANATNVALLVSGKYLSSAPVLSSTISSTALDLSGSSVTSTGLTNANVCAAINAQVGLATTPTTDNVNVAYNCFAATGATTFTFTYH